MTEATREANRLATVFGGSGFLGRHIVRALVHQGWRVRVAVRRPDLAAFLQPIGGVGQIQPVQANLRFPGFDRRGDRGRNRGRQRHRRDSRERGADLYRPCTSRAPLRWRERHWPRGCHRMCIFRESALTRTPPRPISRARGSARKRRATHSPTRSSCVRQSCLAPRMDFFNRFGALACHLPDFAPDGRRRKSLAAGLCRRCRPGGRRRGLRLGEARHGVRTGRSTNNDPPRSGRAHARRNRSPASAYRPSPRSVALDRVLDTVRVEGDIRAFSQIADDDPRSSRFACVRQRRIRGGGSPGTRAELPRHPAAGRRGDHPILPGAISADWPI